MVDDYSWPPYPVSINDILNDLLGGRGWWLVKGALVRGPFLFLQTVDYKIVKIHT